MKKKVTAYKCEEFEVEADSDNEAIAKCNPLFYPDYYEVEDLDEDEDV